MQPATISGSEGREAGGKAKAACHERWAPSARSGTSVEAAAVSDQLRRIWQAKVNVVPERRTRLPSPPALMRECAAMAQRIDNRTRRRDPAAKGGVFTAFGLAAEAEPLAPGLYVVATPIGNLRDVSFRALAVLAAADAVLAEDTRVTKTLLAHYGITTPLVAYHEHSNEAVRERMLTAVRDGQALALVSDAGTPLVSDPGYKLVQAAIAEGLPVTPIPGPSAILTALVVSGLPTDRFFFEGFLPPKSAARKTRLAEIAGSPGTLMLFEAPHRLPEMLADAAEVLGERPAVMARELTKMFETVRRGTPAGARRAICRRGAAQGRDRRPDRRGDRGACRPPKPMRCLDDRIKAALAAPFDQGCGGAGRGGARYAEARGLCPRARSRQGQGRVKTAAARRRATFAARPRCGGGGARRCSSLKGYRPLARRYAAAGGRGRPHHGARRHGRVRRGQGAARSMDDALVAITATKRRRFSRAARAWLARNPWAAGRTWRADAVFVAPWRWPRHDEAAFEMEMS